jgi:hypothetical protein
MGLGSSLLIYAGVVNFGTTSECIEFICLSCPEIALQQTIQHDRKKA